jgi:aspartyl-tRNA(Asn)/glutamyl-tRNA(Gln) amidotransferase subunit C
VSTNPPADLDIDHVATLARIALSPAEKQAFSAQLGDVLAYIELLKEADIAGVEPTAHSFPVEAALRNAPSAAGNMFSVPKVVD